MALSTIQSLSETPETLLTPQIIPNGYRFQPNDQELIRFYLYERIANPDLFTAINIPVRDCHLFGDQAREPWQIWDSFPKRSGEDLFFFTQLTKKGRNSTRQIRGGPSTWHQEFKEPPFSVSIDHNHRVEAVKKVFSYKNPKSDQNSSWLMYEYSLPSLSQHTVLCQLRKKDVHTEVAEQTTRTGAKKRKRDIDDHNGVQPQNFDYFHCQPPAVQDFEDNLTVTDSDFTSTTTSNVALPTVIAVIAVLNPAENLQPIDNDWHAAATEDEDPHDEILGILNSIGGYDEANGYPETYATAESSAYWLQPTPTLDGLFTADAVDHHLELGVSGSSFTNWTGSFSQMLQEPYIPDWSK